MIHQIECQTGFAIQTPCKRYPIEIFEQEKNRWRLYLGNKGHFRVAVFCTNTFFCRSATKERKTSRFFATLCVASRPEAMKLVHFVQTEKVIGDTTHHSIEIINTFYPKRTRNFSGLIYFPFEQLLFQLFLFARFCRPEHTTDISQPEANSIQKRSRKSFFFVMGGITMILAPLLYNIWFWVSDRSQKCGKSKIQFVFV